MFDKYDFHVGMVKDHLIDRFHHIHIYTSGNISRDFINHLRDKEGQ